jgi:DNA-binding beta-propeller fold protein YncE
MTRIGGGLALLLGCLLQAPVAGAGGLELLWETGGFNGPESAVYDPEEGVLYVSNVNGDPAAKDGNGFISRVSLDGEVLDHEWLTGLNAPKGLAIHQGRMYAADIDTLVVIDMTTARVIQRHEDPDARFMNDVTVGSDGSVFVSDSFTNRIYRLAAGKLGVWIESPVLDSPNGLFAENDRLVVGSWGSSMEGQVRPGQLLAVSLADKSVSSISGGKGVGHLDGIARDHGGNYYVTDWMAGKLLRVTSAGAVETLLELTMGTADLVYVGAAGMIVLPRMMDNSVAAYRAPVPEPD